MITIYTKSGEKFDLRNDFPFFCEEHWESLSHIKVDGEDLTEVRRLFIPVFATAFSIPMTNADEVIWFGDIAKTILANWVPKLLPITI
jgi:hypothetical protein